MKKMPESVARSRDELLAGLPEPWAKDLRTANAERLAGRRRKVLVLDDDPTGTQTVHDLWVFTRWERADLAAALADDAPPVTYLLTNSRSLPEAEAAALSRSIARRAMAVAGEVGVDLTLISRSDSTLRGHYPAEPDALRAGMVEAGQADVDGVLLCPFFAEGGRLTIGDVHYVAEDDRLVPAGATAFARDATFGYEASDLKAWVQEKTRGRVRARAVASLPLAVVRREGPDGVRRVLEAVTDGRVVVVNAVTGADLDVVVAGLLEAEAAGKRFLFRTGASFVKHYAGLADRPVLEPAALRHAAGRGGLVVVGSYVPRSTRQLERLLQSSAVVPVEAPVAELLDEGAREGAIASAGQAVNHALAAEKVAVLYTSRATQTAHGRAGELPIARRVSAGLCDIVQAIDHPPRFLIAKGGITSSDLATRALQVRRAWVLGQALPGVPAWRLGAESRWPALPYVVFPGNLGAKESLADLVGRLS